MSVRVLEQVEQPERRSRERSIWVVKRMKKDRENYFGGDECGFPNVSVDFNSGDGVRRNLVWQKWKV